MFKGYCFMESGKHLPQVNLENVEEAIEYFNLKKELFYRVMIVDSGDSIVLESKNGEVVFPT